ncbi:hypothetical protein ABZP36_022155 [Zizania latifolia]
MRWWDSTTARNMAAVAGRLVVAERITGTPKGCLILCANLASSSARSHLMKPVDVVGLQLDDYYKTITKPMDFTIIQNKLEGKDETKYNNVREIYADVRLIFANAMKYNDERHDVHIMAKSLLEKFEEKWLQLLPKVENEERKQKDEESNDVPSTKTSPEEAFAKLAKDTDNEENDYR